VGGARGRCRCWLSCHRGPQDGLTATFLRVGHDPPTRDGDDVASMYILVEVQGRMGRAIMDNKVI